MLQYNCGVQVCDSKFWVQPYVQSSIRYVQIGDYILGQHDLHANGHLHCLR